MATAAVGLSATASPQQVRGCRLQLTTQSLDKAWRDSHSTADCPPACLPACVCVPGTVHGPIAMSAASASASSPAVSNPVVLVSIDGWGHSANTKGNAIAAASTPHMTRLSQSPLSALIDACGLSVGLPAGVMGNSEVSSRRQHSLHCHLVHIHSFCRPEGCMR